MDLDKPIFIIGNPRSGTSLLRLMLNNHPDVLIPPECGFIQWWYKKYKKFNKIPLNTFLNDLLSSKKIETWNLDRKSLFLYLKQNDISNYPNLCAHICKFYGLSKNRKCKRWGDKNNYYVNHMSLIHENYPQAFYLFIIRDIRDVVCSYRAIKSIKLKSAYLPRLPYEIEDIVDDWNHNNEKVLSFLAKIPDDRKKILKYEDLVLNPEKKMREVCTKLKIDFSFEMLEYYSDRSRYDEPEDFLLWKRKTMSPPDATNIGKYKKKLNDIDLGIIYKKGDKLMKLFNYKE